MGQEAMMENLAYQAQELADRIVIQEATQKNPGENFGVFLGGCFKALCFSFAGTSGVILAVRLFL